MTVLVELLLDVALLIALVVNVVTWIWNFKSNNSFSSRVAQFLTHIALVAIEVGLLKVRFLTGQNYWPDIIAFLWLLNVVLDGLSMRI